MRRRHLIQTGLLGAAVLGAAAWVGPRVWDTGSALEFSQGQPPSALSPQAAALVAALAPVVIGSACNTDAHRQQAVESVGMAVARLSPSAQREMGELFSLLSLAPARGLSTGIWGDWASASAEELSAFLQRWRHSRLGLLQSGYHALHDLILGAWYADDRHWQAIGYAGPPSLGNAA